MRIMTTVVLMALAFGLSGCGSHDSNQVGGDSRAVRNHAGGEKAYGEPKSPAVVSVPVVNQAANQATAVIHTAAVDVNRAAYDVNRTTATVQVEAQQVTNDAARLTNDAARLTNDAANASNNVLNDATHDFDRLKNALR